MTDFLENIKCYQVAIVRMLFHFFLSLSLLIIAVLLLHYYSLIYLNTSIFRLFPTILYFIKYTFLAGIFLAIPIGVRDLKRPTLLNEPSLIESFFILLSSVVMRLSYVNFFAGIAAILMLDNYFKTDATKMAFSVSFAMATFFLIIVIVIHPRKEFSWIKKVLSMKKLLIFHLFRKILDLLVQVVFLCCLGSILGLIALSIPPDKIINKDKFIQFSLASPAYQIEMNKRCSSNNLSYLYMDYCGT